MKQLITCIIVLCFFSFGRTQETQENQANQIIENSNFKELFSIIQDVHNNDLESKIISLKNNPRVATLIKKLKTDFTHLSDYSNNHLYTHIFKKLIDKNILQNPNKELLSSLNISSNFILLSTLIRKTPANLLHIFHQICIDRFNKQQEVKNQF